MVELVEDGDGIEVALDQPSHRKIVAGYGGERRPSLERRSVSGTGKVTEGIDPSPRRRGATSVRTDGLARTPVASLSTRGGTRSLRHGTRLPSRFPDETGVSVPADGPRAGLAGEGTMETLEPGASTDASLDLKTATAASGVVAKGWRVAAAVTAGAVLAGSGLIAGATPAAAAPIANGCGGVALPGDTRPTTTNTTYTVQRGDHLYQIVRDIVFTRAALIDNREVAREVRKIVALNRSSVKRRGNLIQPGTTLKLPESLHYCTRG